jgi:GNAT superfamily N-acetyltransferase
MVLAVEASTDAQFVLERASEFLERDPVRNNLVLTLLHNRAAFPEPGRYWLATSGSRVSGVAFQSPLRFIATITPMATDAVAAIVDAIAGEGVSLPGVNGDVSTSALFAGAWTERTKCAARPVSGQRIYEIDAVVAARPTPGTLRRATLADRELLIAWLGAFNDEIGETVTDPAEAVDRRLAAGAWWLWDDGAPVAMAGRTVAVAGVARIGPVYTPRERRGRGYASALVGGVSTAIRDEGDRCILYTDLENPTSNSIYRALGYRAVAEVLRYAFIQ